MLDSNKGICRLNNILRLLYPLPLAIISYIAIRSTLPMIPGYLNSIYSITHRTGSIGLLAYTIPSLLAGLLAYVIGMMRYHIQILYMGLLYYLSVYAGSPVSLIAVGGGLLVGLLLYTLSLDCGDVAGVVSVVSSRCEGYCPVVWVGYEVLQAFLVVVLVAVPFLFVERLMGALVGLGESLPRDTRLAWIALVDDPIVHIIIYLTVLFILFWVYTSITGWLKVALFTTRYEARKIISKYLEDEAERISRGKTWYHRIYLWAATFIFVAASELVLAVVFSGLTLYSEPYLHVSVIDLFAATTLASIFISLIIRLYILPKTLTRETGKALKTLTGFLTAYIIITAIPIILLAGPDYITSLLIAAIHGTPPPQAPPRLEEALSNLEALNRLIEEATRIILRVFFPVR